MLGFFLKGFVMSLVITYVCACVCVCVSNLSLVQSLDGGISSICMAGLYRVVGTNAQHRARVSTRPISYNNHSRPVTTWDPTQVFLCELRKDEKQRVRWIDGGREIETETERERT